MKSTKHSFNTDDAVGKLKALGFIDCRECPGWRYEMLIDDTQVTAAITYDSVFVRATWATKREIAEMDIRVPIKAPIGSYAKAIAQIMCKRYPEAINRDALWASDHVIRAKWQRPWVTVSRALLRKDLKALKQRVNSYPVPDARLDYKDNAQLGGAGELTITIGDAVAMLPATGIWVGRLWVKSRDLFKSLEQRFQMDPVMISLSERGIQTQGKWLLVGSRNMRAGWEIPAHLAERVS